jgi:predicted signal transduction protein with EAL and GGDEF domain
VWTDLTASPIRDSDGVPVFIVALVEDVTALRELRERLQRQAMLADTVLAVLTGPIVIDEHRLVVSASIGVVECPVDETTPAEILKAADVTLYWAKSDGRDRWARFDPERHARDMTRYTLSATLLPGLERDEFRVEYQPIVGLSDVRAVGVEALVRWVHPTFGPLSPDRFIDLAEETGPIVQPRTPRAEVGLRARCRVEHRASRCRALRQRQPRCPPGTRPRPRRRRHARSGPWHETAHLLDTPLPPENRPAVLTPGRPQP